MKKILAIILGFIIIGGTLYSCASKNQCRRYAKSQRKKKRAELVVPIQKTVFYYNA